MNLHDAISAIPSARPWLAAAGALLYSALAGLCAAAWRRTRRSLPPAGATAWSLLALAQVFLAADALFGIRQVIAEIGRGFFRRHGWYEEHRIFQAIISALAILAAAILAWRTLRPSQRLTPGIRLATAGTILAFLLFLISAISMHFFEDLADWPFEPLALGTSLRATGCLLTAAGACQSLRRPALAHNGLPPSPA